MILVASLNPLFQAAAENSDMGWLLGLMTLFFMVSFAGWLWYAMNPASRERWEAAGRMPFDDGNSGGEA